MTTYYVDDSASIAWPTSTAVSLGDRVYGSGGETVMFECTTAGTTGATEPVWDTTVGNTTADNTATWTARDATSWANAWNSIVIAMSTTIAGDEIRVAHTHVQATSGAAATYTSSGTNSNPIKVLSTDSTDDTYQRGATIYNETGVYSLNFRGTTYYAGIDIVTAGDVDFSYGNIRNEFYDIVTDVRHIKTSINGKTRITSSTLNLTGNIYLIGGAVFFECINSTINSSNTSSIIWIAQESLVVRFIGCDFSGSTSTKLIYGAQSKNRNSIKFIRCKLKAPLVFTASTVPGYGIEFEGCIVDSATQTLTVTEPGLSQWEWYPGRIKTDITRYRTGGADDGEQVNEQSWSMETDSYAVEQLVYLESPKITRWVDAGASQTVTLYLASYATLNDDDFWIEVISPSEEATATAQGKFRSTKILPLAAPVALTTDATSTWNGTNVGTKQKITVTISPTIAGPVTINCFLAKPSVTTPVYIDPRLEIA